MMIFKKLKIGGGDIVTKKSRGGVGSHTHNLPGHNHTSSFDGMAGADCVIGFYPDGKVRIIRDRYGHNHIGFEQDKTHVIELLLEKLSSVIFNQKLKMFQTTFNGDMRSAFKEVLEEHKIKVKGINE